MKMQRQNVAAGADVQRGGPKPKLESLPFYLTDKALRDGTINKNWTLDGPGTQMFAASVYFPDPFDAVPTVVAAITGINGESDGGGDWAVQMKVVGVQADHFDVEVTKQGNIQVHLVNAVWVAWIGV
jgi:hypothetical protein